MTREYLNHIRQLILVSGIVFAVCACKKTGEARIITNNQWDGVYNLSFCNYNPASGAAYPCTTTVVHLITTGPNTVKLYWPLNGAYSNPSIDNAGNFIFFGIQEPEYTINPASNAVTVQNAASGAVTFYTMALGWSNDYDPVTRKFTLKWGYNYAVPGFFDPACREWKQILTYSGSR